MLTVNKRLREHVLVHQNNCLNSFFVCFVMFFAKESVNLNVDFMMQQSEKISERLTHYVSEHSDANVIEFNETFPTNLLIICSTLFERLQNLLGIAALVSFLQVF